MDDGVDGEGTGRRRGRVRANRSRIIEAAIAEFAANPDASMDDVARAAGVVRRTVYGHFPNREALVQGIADEASAALVSLLDGLPDLPDRPDLTTALLALLSWPVGDRFRVLLTFARRELGEERIRDLLVPARAPSLAIIERGQADGVFSRYLPAPVLVALSEAIALAMFEEANRGAVTDSGESFAVASLVLLGIAPERAAAIADEATRWLRESSAASGR
ncbi:TetR/AcrR family transcriptional regulator [Rhodococcus sp. NPDC058505]|uniref:TetR/AcrR family transcriptional regulator n=1 Tax=Rhodococcus sp. NPDC058505 TaxID=3346531 RepID=UPI00366340DE